MLLAATAVAFAATGPTINAAGAGMAAPNDLHYVAGTLAGLSATMPIFTIEAARVALQPDGVLVRLGAGVQKLSTADAASLARWRVGLGGLSALQVFFGLNMVGPAIANAGGLFVPPGGLDWQNRVGLGIMGLTLMFVWPVIISGWWASMHTASTLCRDDITEVRPPTS